MTMSVNDVRCGPQQIPFICSDANDSGGNDANFATIPARLSARITDRFNLPAPGGRSSATTKGYAPFEFDGNCSSTPQDRTTGANCSANTTLEVFYPGAVKEGMRANLELGQVEVYDNGGDNHFGEGPPEQVFLRQGVFVP